MSRVLTPGLAIERHKRSASATSLPASRISAISRGDFSSGALVMKRRNTLNSPCTRMASRRRLPQRFRDPAVYFFDFALTVDRPQFPLASVMLDKRLRVLMIHVQPVADCLLPVISTLD